MSLRIENLEDIVQRSKEFAEMILELAADNSDIPWDEARDLVSMIETHEAIHGPLRQR